MRKILVVNDDDGIQKMLQAVFGRQFSVIRACTLHDSKVLYDENRDVYLIVMSGCVDNLHDIDTIPLVREIRQTYQGLMLAASGRDDYNDLLLQAGCDCKISGPGDLLPKIRMILG